MIGEIIIEVSKALESIKPDVLLAYGDRYESFAAVIAASQMSIPVAHIEGGDLTEGGALDDSVRHAITKLAHLHFTTNQQATNRVLGMGEEAWRVLTVGLPALDLILDGQYAVAQEVLYRLRLDLGRPIILFTFHSVVAEVEDVGRHINESIVALLQLEKMGYQIIVTYPNNDLGCEAIVSAIHELEKMKLSGIQIHKSLGRHLYHGVLALARVPGAKVVCVGNSSSGLKESGAFGCPTLNIGSRQNGRLRGENVIDVNYDSESISSGIRRCLGDLKFLEKCKSPDNPYYFGNAGQKIASILAKVPQKDMLLKKRMTLRGEVLNGWYR
jgi:UDP-N-acetylglucosamine 2-epimerase (non-hydrolysing)/GDP/UDP-N,N'-diacetylbacillosamine 2-epimerase (hydrolysing)